jgi:hypothetical protein
MDKLKGMAEKAMHSGGNTASTGTTGGQGAAGGKEDYGDKGTFILSLLSPQHAH